MTTPNTYIVGQLIELDDLITNPRSAPTPDAPVDDASEALTVFLPDHTSVNVPVTHNGTGLYSADFTPTQDGWHTYVFESTGAGAGAGRGRFWVAPVP